MPRAKDLGDYISTGFIMIDKYNNFKLAALQVLTPSLKSFSYGPKFLFISFVLILCQDYFQRKKSYEILLSKIFNSLIKNFTYNIAGSTVFNTNIAFKLRSMENKTYNKN